MHSLIRSPRSISGDAPAPIWSWAVIDHHRDRGVIRSRRPAHSTQVSTIPSALAGRWTLERRRAVAAALLSELRLAMLATHTFPLAAVADAFAALGRGKDGLINAALCYD